MPDADRSPVLEAFAEGRLTRDEAFADLYRAYGRTTRAWIATRAPSSEVDDLLQEVWSIFWRRWREWVEPAGVAASDPRPVLSFLFRTCHLTLMAHRRLAAVHAAQSIEEAPEPAVDGQQAVHNVQLGECLVAAQACCDDIELAILSAKLSGVSGRDTARVLGLSEPTVDHRYRAALARIRARLTTPQRVQERSHGH